MMAHCVRCHGAGGTLNKDPALIGEFKGLAPASSYLDTFEDPPTTCKTVSGVPCQGAKASAVLIKAYVTYPDATRMPPLPADKLSDVQVDLLVRWTVDKLP